MLPIPPGITAQTGLATNVAITKNASVEEVCSLATWSSVSSFIRRYKINVFSFAEASFDQRVLQLILDKDDDSPTEN